MSGLEKLLDEESLGKRSASPPRRQDWRAGERSRDENSDMDKNSKGRGRSRSRSGSRSPIRRRRFSSRERQHRYELDGSNTTRDEPHLRRARIFVGNIEPAKVQKRDLIRLFSEFGDVLGVSVHKGYAFIQMDRERNANRAINYLDNQMFMGAPIHVEYSQAALKAGARFERLPARHHSPPPPPARERSSEAYAMLQLERERDVLRDREERLSRILQMEKELAILHSREELYESVSRRSRLDHHALERERGPPASDSYRRPSPPSVGRDFPHLGPSQSSGYSLNGGEDRRSLYGRPSDRGSDRSYDRPPSPPSRAPVSYPQPGAGRLASSGSGVDRREGFSSQFGSGGGYGSSHYGASGLSGASAGVGYGGRAGMNPGKPAGLSSGGAPPGWPQSEYKSNVNRPPFAGGSRWN